MLPIIRQSERHEEVSYSLVYACNDCEGAGFSFPCNEDGKLLLPMNDVTLDNYCKCVAGVHDVTCEGVRKDVRRWTEPAVGQCECGHSVELAEFTNTCAVCGRDYNMSGQRLAPRSQWGEETGESLGDILGIGHHIS